MNKLQLMCVDAALSKVAPKLTALELAKVKVVLTDLKYDAVQLDRITQSKFRRIRWLPCIIWRADISAEVFGVFGLLEFCDKLRSILEGRVIPEPTTVLI